MPTVDVVRYVAGLPGRLRPSPAVDESHETYRHRWASDARIKLGLQSFTAVNVQH